MTLPKFENVTFRIRCHWEELRVRELVIEIYTARQKELALELVECLAV